jgi:hypothetical protein
MPSLCAVATDTPSRVSLLLALLRLGAEALKPRLAGLAQVLGAATVIAASTALAARAAGEPIVPFTSRFSHWDHHWYVWLPRDPVYEAVEVMSADRPGASSPLVWAFFTERAAPKRQHHYVNDPALAAQTGRSYAAIDYAASGAAGGPLGLAARFADVAGQPVAIAVDFPAGVGLSPKGGGLTNQIGHSGDRVFLIFYREAAARTEASRVTVGGVERSEPVAGAPPLPFRAAYSRNIFVATIPFGEVKVAFGAERGVDLDFIEEPGKDDAHRLFVATRAGGERIELVADRDGRLERYLDRRGAHFLAVDFSPPLAASGDSAYRIGLDDFHDLVAGVVRPLRDGNALLLDWRPQAPEWTRSYPLLTRSERGADGAIALTVSKATP